MAYATVAELKRYMPQVTDSGEDPFLSTVLDRATDMVDDHLGFSFAAHGATATERDVWSGNGGDYLLLPAYKAGSLASVYLVTDRGGDSEDDTTEVDDYTEDERWRLWRAAKWPRRAWYRCSAIWGPGTAPESIKEVTIEIAVNIWRGRDAGAFDRSGAEGGGSIAYARALTWSQRSAIDRVRMQFWGAWPAR